MPVAGGSASVAIALLAFAASSAWAARSLIPSTLASWMSFVPRGYDYRGYELGRHKMVKKRGSTSFHFRRRYAHLILPFPSSLRTPEVRESPHPFNLTCRYLLDRWPTSKTHVTTASLLDDRTIGYEHR
ncbi:hypothetical protein GW17_00025313 [Ensete ventricosum]|nr:hypothetical protein GW17_00025313 [Ensete ventricosum]